jgi:flagellin
MNMTGIVLSASVRQNLLSLQSTASLLATTQNDLATGNKVNTALDNPTSFFTASALNNRATDIANLLDGIGNGVQVLQAANTGITSLQSLVASAQSVANQVLQTPIGYDTKSSITSSAVTGATANNLLGTGNPATSGSLTAGAFTTLDLAGASAATAAAPITGGAFTALDVSSGSISFSLTVDSASTSVVLNAAAVTAFTGAGGTLTGTVSALTASDVAKIVDYQADNTDTTGAGPVTVNGAGHLLITSPTTGTGSHLGIGTITSATATNTTGLVAVATENGAAAGATPASSQVFTVTVDGGTAKTITLNAANVTAYNTAKGTTLDATSLSANDVASLINYQYDNTGAKTVASGASGKLVFTSGTTGASSNVVTSAVTGTAAGGSTGIASATGTAGTVATNALNGETLTVGATGNGVATTITLGTGTGQISTLNDLNTALASDNLQATIDSTGVLTITTSNNAASSKLGGTAGISGSATTGSGIFASATTIAAAVADPNAQATRSGLVDQYNNILKQIDTTAQDSSFNGINLLEGDTLNLTFDETGRSTLAIKGVTFNDAGLGLSTLANGIDFLDSNSANAVLASLNNVSTTLRSEASNLGSNLSIVQIRQDFSKNLINVLQTGASNLTLADTNEEAANSQALSTRQSIAVSALALANTSQQSVLQLLR